MDSSSSRLAYGGPPNLCRSDDRTERLHATMFSGLASDLSPLTESTTQPSGRGPCRRSHSKRMSGTQLSPARLRLNQPTFTQGWPFLTVTSSSSPELDGTCLPSTKRAVPAPHLLRAHDTEHGFLTTP